MRFTVALLLLVPAACTSTSNAPAGPDGVDASAAEAAAQESGTSYAVDASFENAVPAKDASSDDAANLPDGLPYEASDPGDGGACTSLANIASAIPQMDVAQTIPPPSGGTLVDGLYVKTRDTVYTGAGGASGPTGTMAKETLGISGSATGTARFDSVFLKGTDEINERITFVPGPGGSGAVNIECPPYGPLSWPYTVRNTGTTIELDLYTFADRIETFTRQ
jgi:hypothetical protein